MANFSTHLGVAALGSGMLSTLCLQVGFVDGKDAILLAAAGTIGGILPDIDLHYSYPSRIIFSVLGIILSFFWIFSARNNISIIELWGAGLGIFLFVRYPLWAIFNHYTVHRGSIHSIASALMFATLASALSFQVFSKTAFHSWLIALFIFSGFILHLLLDEIYSVDFMGHRLKKSFGTALKIVDAREQISTAVILAILLMSWFFTPPTHDFFDTIVSQETYNIIADRFF